MKIDIFPAMGLPTIYIAQPYGGLSPEQMEGFITSYYEYHFLYISGVKYIDSKSVQGACIVKIEFQEGTDISQAMAEVVAEVDRSRAFMPPGTVPPFIIRFDAGSVPVGELVFTSKTRSLGEMQDLALFRVRPLFSTLPGVSAPPPFGGNQKTIIISVNPNKVRDYKLSPDQLVQSLAKYNTISPAGNARIGKTIYITPQNSIIESMKDFEQIPITIGNGPAVYLRDVASVYIGSDIASCYALINGKRSIYIPVTKHPEASTWTVVQEVKAALPEMQAAIPEDIKVSYEFDQSGYVIKSLKSLLFEGGSGAILTGLMVLLFLGDLRSVVVVVLTIPLALLTAVTFLFICGQTLNIMTLGGLALSVGILVDQATVAIENIHQHMERGVSKAKAILDATTEIVGPLFLILLCILAVFVPALFMTGIPKDMFMPLSLSVGFAMIASFCLALTFVPVMSNWVLKGKDTSKHDRFNKFREHYINVNRKMGKHYKLLSLVFLAVSICLALTLLFTIGEELFPKTDSGQAQVRLRMPIGTRIEETEKATLKLLDIAEEIVGKGNVVISSAFVGTQPSSYAINNVYLWTSGPQESVTKIQISKNAKMKVEDFQERMRAEITKQLPEATISFEPGDIVGQVLNVGTTNPIEIDVLNLDLKKGDSIAEGLITKLKEIKSLRDLQIATPLDYPSININIDRVRAAQLGLSLDQIVKSTVVATSSSRFTTPSYWLDKISGTAYQVQVQYPEYTMNATAQLEQIPVSDGITNNHYLSEVASWQEINTVGEYDRYNQQRYVTITANITGEDAGSVFKKVNKIIAETGNLPRGTKIALRGQPALLAQTFTTLQYGLVIAVVVIFLMISIYFQSFLIAVSTLFIVPAVVSGSLLLLLITGNTLNIQSYMGTIMAVGVAIANAILLLSNAELNRKDEHNTVDANLKAAESRLRPILMTGFAMLVGMLPMSLGGDQTAPLGIAVIGGLLFSMLSVLFLLPHIYQFLIGRKDYRSVSLDPYDKNSKNYEQQ